MKTRRAIVAVLLSVMITGGCTTPTEPRAPIKHRPLPAVSNRPIGDYQGGRRDDEEPPDVRE